MHVGFATGDEKYGCRRGVGNEYRKYRFRVVVGGGREGTLKLTGTV